MREPDADVQALGRSQEDLKTFASKLSPELPAGDLFRRLGKELGLNIEVGVKTAFVHCWSAPDRSKPHIFLSSIGSGAFVTPYFSVGEHSQRPTSLFLETSRSKQSAKLVVTPSCFALPRHSVLPDLTYFKVTKPFLEFVASNAGQSHMKIVFSNGADISLTQEIEADCEFMAQLILEISSRGLRVIAI